MNPGTIIGTLLFASLMVGAANAEDFSYEAIAKRYIATRLDAASVKEAQMQGECLVGLKNLIFVRRDHFDPVAEWINYRAISLLGPIPPCTVLIMMEVARAELVEQEGSP